MFSDSIPIAKGIFEFEIIGSYMTLSTSPKIIIEIYGNYGPPYFKEKLANKEV